MTVRIIKPGFLVADIKYIAICHSCACQFEFTGADGKTTCDPRDGSFITIACPTCGKPVHQKARTANDEMRRRAIA